jgi:hypothetical protein
MLSQPAAGIGRGAYPDVAELAELQRISDSEAVRKSRPELLAIEEALSLPEQALPADPCMALLSGVLGPQLSTDNRAWRGDPVPCMRSLQQKLLEHALSLPQALPGHDLSLPQALRAPALQAIRVLELAVRYRLRWQHMRRCAAEGQPIHPPEETPDAKPPRA